MSVLKRYDEHTNTGVDLSEKHTMSGVWDVLDQALDRYRNKDIQGSWGRIRNAFRKLGEHSGAVEGWLGLLPKESHYLSVVCGGFKLILTVRFLNDHSIKVSRASAQVSIGCRTDA